MSKNRSERIEELLSSNGTREHWAQCLCVACRKTFKRTAIESEHWTRGPGGDAVCFDCFVRHVTGRTGVTRFIVGAGSEFAFAALTVNPENGEYAYLVRDMGIDTFKTRVEFEREYLH